VSRSVIGHISRRTLNTGLAVFVGIIVLFFAATRTEVGRSHLARTIQSQFAARTGAELSIGRLSGNMLSTLYAADVTVRHPDGRELAHADLVVLRPRWSSLLRKDISVHRIDLFQPRVRLGHDSTGTSLWDFGTPARAEEHSAEPSGWRFRNATVRTAGGAILWESMDPRSTVGFNGLSDIQLEAVLDWTGTRGQFDMQQFSAGVTGHDLTITELAMQVLVDEDRLTVTQSRLRTDASSIQFRGSLPRSETSIPFHERAFQVEIEPSTIDTDEWRSLLPGLPVHGAPRLALNASGPLSDLAVAWARIESGSSRAELSGTFSGYPGPVLMDLSVSRTTLAARDLRGLFPGARVVRDLSTDLQDVQVYANGSLDWNRDQGIRMDMRSSFTLSSAAGTISGSGSLSGSLADTLRHDLTIRMGQFDVQGWTNRPRWNTTITGLVSAEGWMSGSVASFHSNVQGDLTGPRWGARRADSLSVSLTVQPDVIFGEADLFANGGSILSRLNLTRSDGQAPFLETFLTLDQADVGPLLGYPGMASRIDATVQASGTLAWNASSSGHVRAEVAPSMMSIDGDSVQVAPHRIETWLRTPDEAAPVLEVRSDMADVTVQGDVPVSTIWALGRSWVAALRASVDIESRKTRGEQIVDALDPTIALDEWLTDDAVRSLLPVDTPAAHTSVEARLHSGALLSALSPVLPRMGGEGFLTADLVWSADSLHTTLRAGSASSWSLEDVTLVHPEVDVSLALRRQTSVLPSLSGHVRARADSIASLLGDVAAPDLNLSVEQGTGVLTVSSAGAGRVDSTNIRAHWTHKSDRNDIRFDSVNLRAGRGLWALSRPATFQVFGDATVLDTLELAFFENGESTGQALSATGILSAQPTDSLSVTMQSLLLRPLSEFLGWQRTLGGRVDGQILVRGGLAQPRITGRVDVAQLSLDHYLLGDVRLTSEYLRSRPDVAVSLQLTPLPPDQLAVLLGTDIPAVVLQNDLSLAGDLRLPGQDPDGALNLDLEVDRADVFWMKYLFPEALGSVSGFLSGSGRIGGSFSYPLFDVRLGVLDGRFYIPYTNVTYEASGSLRVDRTAIHFEPLLLRDTSGGTADVTGRLLFNDYTSFTFDIDGALDDLQFMNVAQSEVLPFYGFIWASGDIELTGPLFDARLVTANGRTHEDSELFIPIKEETSETDQAFIIFEETPGVIPDFDRLVSRSFILQKRPTSERQFLDGLSLDLNIDAPPGSTVHLVIDPLLGDVINAVSQGEVQLILEDDEFQVFGRLDVTSGDYQFTAGELFIKTFQINPGGSIVWSGDPVNATLDIPASYRTRASRAGLPGAEGERPGVIPLIVNLQIDGTVESPEVDLSLAIDRSNQNVIGDYQAIEAVLNQPDRATEYATSVLILNSFQLTTENITTDSGSQLAFNSVSQLVTAQLNRFLASALPNVDFSFGLQGESAQDLDVTYGVALRLLNERLIIRGEGVYQGARSADNVRTSDGLQGEFVVEVRLSPRVSVEVFFRRESDILDTAQLSNTAGVGLSYQTEFESWRRVFGNSPSTQ
jgi:translocation and assembly module TamB